MLCARLSFRTKKVLRFPSEHLFEYKLTGQNRVIGQNGLIKTALQIDKYTIRNDPARFYTAKHLFYGLFIL